MTPRFRRLFFIVDIVFVGYIFDVGCSYLSRWCYVLIPIRKWWLPFSLYLMSTVSEGEVQSFFMGTTIKDDVIPIGIFPNSPPYSHQPSDRLFSNKQTTQVSFDRSRRQTTMTEDGGAKFDDDVVDCDRGLRQWTATVEIWYKGKTAAPLLLPLLTLSITLPHQADAATSGIFWWNIAGFF